MRKYFNIALNNQYFFDTLKEINCPFCYLICKRHDNDLSCKCEKFAFHRYYEEGEFSTVIEINGRFVAGTNHFNHSHVEIFTGREILFDFDMSDWNKFIEKILLLGFYS